MSELSEIKSIIQNIAAQGVGNANNMVFEAEVVDVSDETITIDVDGLRLTDVRTCSMTDGDSNYLHIYPSIGSTVVCLDASGSRRDIIVLKYSAIDKVSLHGGKESTTNGTELKKQLETLTKRVDKLYDALLQSGTDPQGGVMAADVKLKLQSQREKEDWGKIEDKTLLH